jgi:Gpi18-like mannosyltransferase
MAWASLRSGKINVWLILLLGFFLREAFSFWTGHPWDFEVWVRVGYYIAHGLNPYVILDPVPRLSFSGYSSMPSIGYPPTWGLICGLIYKIYEFSGYENRFIYYFLLKQPSVLGDIYLGYALYKFALRFGGKALYAIKFWIFCPFTIIISSIWGMFDGLVISFFITSLMLLFSNKWKLSAFSLSMAILLKPIPAIYVPILTLFEGIKKRLSFISLVAFITFILTMMPFIIYGWNVSGFLNCMFSQGTKYAGLMTFWSFLEYIQYSSLGDSQAFKLLLFLLSLLWIPTLSLFYFMEFKASRFNPQRLIQALTIVTCLFLLSRLAIPEQFATYIIALMLIDTCVWHPKRSKFLHATWLLAFIYTLINNTLLIRFLSPISLKAFNLDIALNNNSPTKDVRNLFMHIFASIFSIMILHYFLLAWRERKSKPMYP